MTATGPRPPAHDDLFRRLLRNAGVILSGNATGALMDLGSLALAARGLGPELFGVLVMVRSSVLVVNSLVNFQVWQALIKFGADALASGRPERVRELIKCGFLLDCCASTAGFLLAVLGAWFAAGRFGIEPDTAGQAALYAIVLLFNFSGSATGVLRLFDRFGPFALQKAASGALRLLGAVAGFLAGAGLWYFVALWAAADVLGYALLGFFAWRELKIRDHAGFLGASLRGIGGRFSGLWGFLVNTNLQRTVRAANKELDTLIVGGVLGAEAAGLYGVAKQIGEAPGKLTDPLTQAIYPEMARLWAAGERGRMRHLALRSGCLAACGALALWFFFLFFGGVFLSLTVGEAYLPAWATLLWYMAASAIAVATFPLTPAVLSMGKANAVFLAMSLATALYLPALWGGLHLFGLAGSGAAYIVFHAALAASLLRTAAPARR